MKTRYTYIHFTSLEDMDQPNEWFCYNNRTRDVLGKIEKIRQYEFMGMGSAWFTADCLRDIAKFMEQLDKERKG